jgi:hypothetical protein
VGARGEEMLVGGLCLLVALVNAWRLWTALAKGEMPLYRTRLRKAEVSRGKFAALTAFNLALLVLLLVIAADLLLGLGLRER